MKKDQRLNIIIALLVVNLLTMYNFYGQIKDDVYDMNREMRNLENRVGNSLQNISYELERMDEKNRKISSLTHTISGFDKARNEAEYTISLKLKEADMDSLVNWRITSQDGDYNKVVTLVMNDDMSFSGKVSLPVTDDYVSDVYEETSGSKVLLNESPITMSLASHYLNMRVDHGSTEGSMSNKGFSELSTFNIRLLDKDVHGIKKVEVLLYNEDQLILTEDVTDQMLYGKDLLALEEEAKKNAESHSGAGFAGGFSTEAAIPSSSGSILEVEFERFYAVHVYNCDYSEVDGLKNGDNGRVVYRFTFLDGHVEGSY